MKKTILFILTSISIFSFSQETPPPEPQPLPDLAIQNVYIQSGFSNRPPTIEGIVRNVGSVKFECASSYRIFLTVKEYGRRVLELDRTVVFRNEVLTPDTYRYFGPINIEDYYSGRKLPAGHYDIELELRQDYYNDSCPEVSRENNHYYDRLWITD